MALDDRKFMFKFLKDRNLTGDNTENEWISYWFKDNVNCIKLWRNLSDEGYVDITEEEFVKEYACDLDWAKKLRYCGGDIDPNTTDPYIGVYKTKSQPAIEFNIVKSQGEYFVSIQGVKFEIFLESGDFFEVKSKLATGSLLFRRDSKNAVVGGTIEIKVDVKVGIPFFKKTLIDREIVGEFVRVGDIGPDGETSSKPKFDFSPWDCINNWNEKWGYYPLLGGQGSGDRFAYEITTYKIQNRPVRILYFTDNTIKLKFQDTDEEVPNVSGTFVCHEDGTGYTVTWQDGTSAVFGSNSKNPGGGGATPPTTDTSGTSSPTGKKTFAQICKSTIACPSIAEIKSGKSYKICMKCKEIEDLQNTPVFKTIYFRKLKENGLSEKVDGIFGPITKEAVEEYQQMNGLTADGAIGVNTYNQMVQDAGTNTNLKPIKKK